MKTIRLTPSNQKVEAAGARIDNTEVETISVDVNSSQVKLTLPASLSNVIISIVDEIKNGRAVTIVPETKELSTSEAAKILGISRQHLVKMLDSGELKIPYRKVGRYRRLQADDVLSFKQELKKKRLATLEELQAQAQELDLGY